VFIARLPDLGARAWPSIVLGKPVRDLEPRRLGSDEEVAFHLVAGRLVQATQGKAHSIGIVVVGADEIRPADRTEVLGGELRGMECRHELLAFHPGELGGPDRGPGAEGGAMPATTPGAMAVQDRPELSLDSVLDVFAKASAREDLHGVARRDGIRGHAQRLPSAFGEPIRPKRFQARIFVDSPDRGRHSRRLGVEPVAPGSEARNDRDVKVEHGQLIAQQIQVRADL